KELICSRVGVPGDWGEVVGGGQGLGEDGGGGGVGVGGGEDGGGGTVREVVDEVGVNDVGEEGGDGDEKW
ncbi:hypothetical protein, partial [Corynebacterium glyciniphilum]|uniref:hypothetical protein n=1 Tax=Corynebacterium glyciniphilum TaxID=1404244 RepID=UPI001C92FEBE